MTSFLHAWTGSSRDKQEALAKSPLDLLKNTVRQQVVSSLYDSFLEHPPGQSVPDACLRALTRELDINHSPSVGMMYFMQGKTQIATSMDAGSSM